MVREAERAAAANTRFVHLRAEELPAGLGAFRVVTFAQSFHWLDRRRVAAVVRDMLEEHGAVAHVGATTHRGEGDVPRAEIGALVRSYLGSVRRAGQGTLPDGTPGDEADVFAAAGFDGPRTLDVGGGELHVRSEDDVVASVFSLSSAAPHLFGEHLAGFEADLRGLLRRASPERSFTERAGEIGIRIWRK